MRQIAGCPVGQQTLIADTVGFIRESANELVAAFRATLAEARDADLLIHVSDAADDEKELFAGWSTRCSRRSALATFPSCRS